MFSQNFKSQLRSEPAFILIPRTCAKCGAEFKSAGRAYTCNDCRKPKSNVRKLTPELTHREIQVTKLVSLALANKEIAYQLNLSEGTIKEYLNRIFKKTRLPNRTALATFWIEKKLSQVTSVVEQPVADILAN